MRWTKRKTTSLFVGRVCCIRECCAEYPDTCSEATHTSNPLPFIVLYYEVGGTNHIRAWHCMTTVLSRAFLSLVWLKYDSSSLFLRWPVRTALPMHMLPRYHSQQQQNEFVPEEDTDSESEVEARDTDKAALQAGEKGRLFGEFERLMRERFLNGDDSDFFDYSTVDNNVLLDDDAITDQDAEDVYFDDD
eukprot:m.183714 g.183714  ORF g.183714 m.183714 type:complete len:190 (+) comp18485_c0_seq1:770-1339(+)